MPRAGVSSPIARSGAVAGQAAAARLAPLTSDQPLPEEDGESATVVMMRQSVEEALAPRPAAGAPPSVEPATTPREPQLSTKVEWYVGIDGEPVGPVDQLYIKSQIDIGKVTSASLVWREQMSDWQPLNSLPEMRVLVSTRSSSVKAPADQASDPIALHKREAPSAPEPRPSAPETKPSLHSSASAVSERAREPDKSSAALLSGAGATELGPAAIAKTERGGPASLDPAPLEAEPPAAKAPEPASDEPLASQPLASQPLASPPDSIPVESEDLAALAGLPAERRRRRRGINPMAYAFIAMATAFGAVSAWFLFGGDNDARDPVAELGPTAQPQPQPGGDIAPPPPPSTDPTPEGSTEQATEAPPDGDASGKLYGKLPDRGTNDGKDKPEPASKGNTPCDPNDPLCSTSGVAGPTAGRSGSGDGESGQGLSQSQASAVVAQYKGSLMRKCRALVTKGGAKVAATITVGASGAVQGVSASGGNEYPGLASCVSSRIRNWTFPASGGSTTVNVSFNFL